MCGSVSGQEASGWTLELDSMTMAIRLRVFLNP